MKVCKNCGTQLTDDALFCNSCGTKVEEDTVTNDVESNNQESIGLYQQPQQPQEEQVNFRELASQAGSSIGALASGAAKTVGNKMNEARNNYNQAAATASINTVALADGEVPIREYAVTRIKSLFSKMSGRLLVTNKRLIFYAGSISDRIVLSTPVDTVGSINFISGRTVRLLRLLLGAGASFVGLQVIDERSSGGFGVITGLLLIIAGVLLIWSSIRKSMFLSISSNNSMPSMVIGKSNTVSSSSYVIDGESDVQADAFMNEIGALVLDLQHMGDAAIDKWKVM